jgi:hypothetical protein
MAKLRNRSVVRRFVGCAIALAVLPSVVAAQSPVYVGGSINGVTQTHSGGFTEPLGGTRRGGSVVFGVQVSRRVAIEFEPSFSFGEPYSWEYTYDPGPSRTAHVVASRRDSFYSFQVRTRMGVLEPVVGLSYLHAKVGRHATLAGGAPYFDESRTDHGLAVVGGLDAAGRLAPHVYFVPTFRLLAGGRWTPESVSGDPLGNDTRTGLFTFRYGAGVRVTF